MSLRICAPDNKVAFKLTKAERKLLLDDIYIQDNWVLRPIIDSRPGAAVAGGSGQARGPGLWPPCL